MLVNLILAMGIVLSNSVSATTYIAKNPVMDQKITCVAKNILVCYQRESAVPIWENKYLNDARGLILVDGLLYLTDDNQAHIYNANSGELIKLINTNGQLFDPIIAENKLILTDTNGNISVLNYKSGQLIWQRKIDDGWLYPPSVKNNQIWTGGQSGIVWSLSLSDGLLLWRKDLGQELVYRPVISKHGLIASTFDGKIHSLDSQTGLHQWVTVLTSAVIELQASNSDEIIASAYDGNLYALQAASGKLLWQAHAHSNARFNFVTNIDRTVSLDYKGNFKIFNKQSGQLIKNLKIEGSHQASPLILQSTIWFYPDDKPAIKLKLYEKNII